MLARVVENQDLDHRGDRAPFMLRSAALRTNCLMSAEERMERFLALGVAWWRVSNNWLQMYYILQ
jgi:hypothetical protein